MEKSVTEWGLVGGPAPVSSSLSFPTVSLGLAKNRHRREGRPDQLTCWGFVPGLRREEEKRHFGEDTFNLTYLPGHLDAL